MDFICRKDFSVKYNKALSDSKTFSADICYKKDEDFGVSTEKLFIQDGISQIYFQDGFYDLLQRANKQTIQEDTYNMVDKAINEYLNLPRIQNLLMSEQKYIAENDRIFSWNSDEIKKFSTCFQSTNFRKGIYDVQCEAQRSINQEKVQYEEKINILNQKYSQEIEEFASTTHSQIEINKKLQEHFQKLDSEKLHLEKAILDIRERGVQRAKELTQNEYLNSCRTVDKKLYKEKDPNDMQKITISANFGLQKKIKCKIKLVQCELSQYLEFQKAKSSRLYSKCDQRVGEIRYLLKGIDVGEQNDEKLYSIANPVYGIFGTGLITLMTYEKATGLKTDSVIGQSMQDNIDLHFPQYNHQVVSLSKSVEEGDIFCTLHSNLGYIKNILHLVEGNQPMKENILESYILEILLLTFKKKLRKIVIPIELIERLKFSKNGFNLNTILDSFIKIIRMVRSGLQNCAYNFVQSQDLNEIQILIPKSVDLQDGTFSKCKDTLKKIFE